MSTLQAIECYRLTLNHFGKIKSIETVDMAYQSHSKQRDLQ